MSSGSIICGAEILNIIPKSIPEKQAAAAIGQILLMKEYTQFLNKTIKVAQILLTKDSFIDQTKQSNVKNTISTLLDNEIIPVINENDTVATDEIEFGDNDILSMKLLT